MSSILYAVKDPEALLDYFIDWTPELAPGEYLITSTWTPTLPNGQPDFGIVVVTNTFMITGTTVWLKGGAVGDPTHAIVNHITTNQGRQDDQTLYIDIWEK